MSPWNIDELEEVADNRQVSVGDTDMPMSDRRMAEDVSGRPEPPYSVTEEV